MKIYSDWKHFTACHRIPWHERCRRFHGHDFKVRVAVEGEVDEQTGVLVDFSVVKKDLSGIIERYDHKTLVGRDAVKVTVKEGEAPVGAGSYYVVDGRYLFPESDVEVMPMDIVSSERIAEHFLSLFYYCSWAAGKKVTVQVIESGENTVEATAGGGLRCVGNPILGATSVTTTWYDFYGYHQYFEPIYYFERHLDMNYNGSDKIVGTLISTISVSSVMPALVYWENVKSLDVQRYINSVVMALDSEEQEYDGFGRESWKDAEVTATLFLYQYNPQGLSDEDTLEQLLQQIHTIVNQYNNVGQVDTVAGNPIVWIKIVDEDREDDVRGAIVYTITFEVRVYISQTIVSPGSSETGLMQLMVNFLSGLPPASTAWTALPFSEVKSLDLQRTGDMAVIHAPNVEGRVIGIGEGQKNEQYTQQQMSWYTFRITLYGQQEVDVEAAADWIAQTSATYFLNAPFGNGNTILSMMESFGQVLYERGTWWREVVLKVEAIVGT